MQKDDYTNKRQQTQIALKRLNFAYANKSSSSAYTSKNGLKKNVQCLCGNSRKNGKIRN